MAASSDRGEASDIPGNRIGEAVERHQRRPFGWGECDCLTFVAGVLMDMGKPDIAAPFRGLYRDEDEAKAVGRVEHCASERFVALGWPEIDPKEAQDGDVGVIGNTLTIRCGDYWWAKDDGTGRGGFLRVRRAWRPA